MDEKNEEQKNLLARGGRKNIIGIAIIIGLLVFIFLINYKKENPLVSSSQKRSVEDLDNKINEILELENKHAFGEIYDNYFSTETKDRLKKDVYVNKAENDFKDKIYFSKITINDTKIDGDLGYIDRTRTDCLDKDCTTTKQSRGYKKYVYANNDWRMVVEEEPTYCIRKTGYEMPEEFKRALSLIIQRYSQSNSVAMQSNGAYISKIQNCLNVQYAKSSDDISDAEGVFVFTPSQSMEKFDIFVSPKYVAKDDLLTSILLSHEIRHVRDFIESQSTGIPIYCFETEARAFSAQNFFALTLNNEEARSLGSRVITNSSPEAQQVFYSLITIPKQKGNDYHEKALNFVKANPAYQKQCKGRN
jgi:hypothetical protein